MQRRIKATVLVCALMSGALFASTVPQRIAFEDGEQFNLTLSRLNFNRIFVGNEKIVKLSYPQGAFVIDKSEVEDAGSLDASVYLKPMTDVPVTVFFTTDKGHHFSLAIHADESFGKTVRFEPHTMTGTQYVKHNTPLVSEVDEAMSAMKAGDMPKDFQATRVISRPFYVNKNIKVSLAKKYEGARLTGYVYRLENKATHPVALSTQLFDKRHAESLALSEETLNPKQVAYLYGLYSHEG